MWVIIITKIDWNNIEERRKFRREYQRLYKQKYPDKVKESQRKYRLSHPKKSHVLHVCKCGKPVEDVPHLRHKNQCRECYNKFFNTYRKNFSKEAVNARSLIARKIKQGIIKPEKCFLCGKNAQAHHPDYSKPLQIAWLCPSHHQKLHYGYYFRLKVFDYSN